MSLITTSNEPQKEAISIFDGVIQALSTTSGHDLKSNIRRCQHACLILGWTEKYEWFDYEINGYPAYVQIPLYRHIQGEVKWVADVSDYERMEIVAENMTRGPVVYERDVESIKLAVYGSIDSIQNSSINGYAESTGELKEWYWERRRKNITLKRIKSFNKVTFNTLLKDIEQEIFKFVSHSYVALRYGNVINDIWTGYRTQVEKTLSSLGLSSHLNVIQTNMQSDNPEAWRLAAYGCRNLIDDLANYLWQDTRDNYDHLPGKSSKGTLEVQKGKSSNRISAYIHQKGLSGTTREYLRDEAERLSSSIRSLISMQSTGHGIITIDNVRSIAIATYIIIGELITRTDMVPVTEYK